MSQDDLEPLPEELALLLRQGRPGAEPPAEARVATLSFVEAHAIAAVAATAPGGITSPTNAPKMWGAIKGSFGAGGIVLGVALGAGAHAALVAREPQPVASVPAPAPVVAPSHEGAPASASAGVAPATSSLAVVVAPPVHSAHVDDEGAKSGRDNALRAERTIIDVAQTAVARSDSESALATLAKHQREFPHGQLAEEREWLAIQALNLAGRRDEARARAAAFRRTFPQSLMLPALDQTAPVETP
jgi:hypothetical protein